MLYYNNSPMDTLIASSAVATRRSGWLDWSAIGLSGLCAVHCLGSAVGVALFSLAGFWGGEATHILALALAIPLALLVLLRARRWIFGTALGGLTLMSLALLAPSAGWEAALTLPGVALLALAHGANLLSPSTTKVV